MDTVTSAALTSCAPADTTSMPRLRSVRPARPFTARRTQAGLAWMVAALLALVWIKTTRVGPVVLVLNKTHGWGVHSGDLWAVGLLSVAAATITMSLRSTAP